MKTNFEEFKKNKNNIYLIHEQIKNLYSFEFNRINHKKTQEIENFADYLIKNIEDFIKQEIHTEIKRKEYINDFYELAKNEHHMLLQFCEPFHGDPYEEFDIRYNLNSKEEHEIYSYLEKICKTTTDYLNELLLEFDQNQYTEEATISEEIETSDSLNSRELFTLFEFLIKTNIFNLKISGHGSIIQDTNYRKFLEIITEKKATTYKDYQIRNKKKDDIERFFNIPDTFGEINTTDRETYQKIRPFLIYFENSDLKSLIEKFDKRIKLEVPPSK